MKKIHIGVPMVPIRVGDSAIFLDKETGSVLRTSVVVCITEASQKEVAFNTANSEYILRFA